MAATTNGAMRALGLEASAGDAHITVSQFPERCQGCCSLDLGTRVRTKCGHSIFRSPPFPISAQLSCQKLPLDKVSGEGEVDQLEQIFSPEHIHLDLQVSCFHGDFHKQVTPLLSDSFPFPQKEQDSAI